MVSEKNKTGLWIAVIAVLLAAIVGVAVYAAKRPKAELPEVTARPTSEVVIREKEVEKIVEVEKTISAEVIGDGLRDMGRLITEEYYFTEVISFSSIKEVLKIEWKITESSFLASYDGVVNAGLDFSAAVIEKDEERKLIRIGLPAAEIQDVVIDPESLTVYSEKSGLGNRITLEDYNNSLIELEKNASRSAVEKGILERADRNAERIVRSFVDSLVDLTAYGLEIYRVD